MFKKLALLLISLGMITPTSFALAKNIEGHNMANQNLSSQNYEIYPSPQEIHYEDKSLTITNKINLVYDESIDKATLNKASDVLSRKEVLFKKSSTIKNDQTNLVLALEGSQLANIVSGDLSYISSKIDAYYLEINENNIIIVGKDSDAVFYGLSTLDLIFLQTNNNIRCLKVKDYSQSKLRGFIEGYYGIPWTAEERQELMRFGSRFKTNIYIYAPKDDVYHSTHWRSLYTENDFKILKEQVQTGIETKTKLAWAIHPFMNKPMTRDTYDADLEIIKNKFDQIYSAGVRQFIVSADDITMYQPGHESERIPDVKHHAELHRDLLNALSIWNKSKGDCEDLVFVPTLYNMISEEYLPADYYQYLMNGLDEDVVIMWTGAKVCSSMNNMAFNEFSTMTGGKKPFIWMNWPVNDYAINYLLLGEGQVFNQTWDEDVPFSGLVINPLQLAEASKLSIFACADYSWNTKDYNMKKSYLDSFKYIEQNEISALIKICSHLTNASKFEDREFPEGEDFKALAELFKSAYPTGSYSTEIKDIITNLTDLVSCCERFLSNSSNPKLVINIAPWVKSLKYTALTVISYLELLDKQYVYDDEQLRTKYYESVELEEKMNSFTAPNLIPGYFSIEERAAYASRTALRPFIEYLKDDCIDDILIRLGIPTGIKCHGLESVYKGKIENIFDGNEETFCWFAGPALEGAYVRIELDEITTIKDIKVVCGNDLLDSTDYFIGKVQLSTDAKNWVDVGLTSDSAISTLDFRDNPVQAKFIRLFADKTYSTKWVSIKEIEFNQIPLSQPKISYSGMEGIYKGDLFKMVDKNLDTFCWFSSNVSAGGFIKIDYRQIKEIKDIKITFGTLNEPEDIGKNDKFVGVLQYSTDGENWTNIGSMNSLTVEFDVRANPITARYLRMYTDETQSGWVAVREIQINVKGDSDYLYSLETMSIEEGSFDNLCDGDSTTFAHFSKGDTHNASITLDLREVKQIENIVFFQGKDDSLDMIYNFSVYISSDNTTWEKVGNDYYQDVKELNLDIISQSKSARYVKIISNWDLEYWVYIREFSINTGVI